MTATVDAPSAEVSVTVSLEDHLRESLKSLLPILPPELSNLLVAELDGSEISYFVLSKISRWARSEEGCAGLQKSGLSSGSYLMVTLLAGTKTAPSSKPPIRPIRDSPETEAKREFNDRKALTAVVNGLLSIGCSGAAAWWAADKSGWRDEWKVLFALFVASIVGLSETVLYIIWQSRHTNNASKTMKVMTIHKKTDAEHDDNHHLDESTATRDNAQGVGGQMRHRAGRYFED